MVLMDCYFEKSKWWIFRENIFYLDFINDIFIHFTDQSSPFNPCAGWKYAISDIGVKVSLHVEQFGKEEFNGRYYPNFQLLNDLRNDLDLNELGTYS